MDTATGAKTRDWFQSAQKVWHLDYEESFLYWSEDGSPSKPRYFRSAKELAKYCTRQELPFPQWAWACDSDGFLLDAEEALAGVYTAQNCLEVRPLLREDDVERLQAVLDDWAMSVKLDECVVNYDVAVIFDRALFDELQNPAS